MILWLEICRCAFVRAKPILGQKWREIPFSLAGVYRRVCVCVYKQHPAVNYPKNHHYIFHTKDQNMQFPEFRRRFQSSLGLTQFKFLILVSSKSSSSSSRCFQNVHTVYLLNMKSVIFHFWGEFMQLRFDELRSVCLCNSL